PLLPHQAHELLPPLAIERELLADVPQAGAHLPRVWIPVNSRQGLIDLQIVTVRGTLEDALGGVFKNTAVALLGLSELQLPLVAFGNILDKAVDQPLAEAAPPLPHPAFGAVGTNHPVLQGK